MDKDGLGGIREDIRYTMVYGDIRIQMKALDLSLYLIHNLFQFYVQYHKLLKKNNLDFNCYSKQLLIVQYHKLLKK